jgi:DHA1 family bicyclomycin/chloramphenicol resistance-like MFS transporter
VNNKVEWKCLFLIIVIFIAACIETDIYLPAFPDMMLALGASEGAIQSLLTWNFFGICISGPLYGPISDAFGRKKPLMVALGMFFLGSIITLFAQNLDQMLWGRVLQGLGSGGCFTLGTAIIFDAFEKEKGVKALNTLNTIVPIIMAGAPILGGYLNHMYGFRSNFLTIAVFVLVSFVVCLFFFDETLAKEKRVTYQFNSILNDFKQAFSCLAFWQVTIVISLLFAGYIAFLSGSSVLFVIEFGVSKAFFPLIQAAILGAWVAGSLFLNRAIRKWGILKIKRAGTILVVIGGVWLGMASLIAPCNAWILTIGVLFYAFGGNWIMGLYFPEAMELLPRIKGVTASLITSVRLLIAALVVGMTSSVYNATIYPLAILIVGTVLVILPTLIFYERRNQIHNTPLA